MEDSVVAVSDHLAGMVGSNLLGIHKVWTVVCLDGVLDNREVSIL